MIPWFQMVASICNFLGHSLEYLGSRYEPEHIPNDEEWFGFLDFKKQYGVAAWIGTVASVLGVGAAFFLPLILPATWLFLFGNCVKAVAEYHKYMNPPLEDAHYSPIRQKALLNFAIANCFLSVVTAVAITLLFVFHPYTLAILIGTTVVGLAVGSVAFKYWLESYSVPDEPVLCNSYQTIEEALENTSHYEPKQELENCLDDRPIAGSGMEFFPSASHTKTTEIIPSHSYSI